MSWLFYYIGGERKFDSWPDRGALDSCVKFIPALRSLLIKFLHFVLSAQATCELGQFQCLSDGECIPNPWLCDDEEDCEDGSDERHNCRMFLLLIPLSLSLPPLHHDWPIFSVSLFRTFMPPVQSRCSLDHQ